MRTSLLAFPLAIALISGCSGGDDDSASAAGAGGDSGSGGSAGSVTSGGSSGQSTGGSAGSGGSSGGSGGSAGGSGGSAGSSGGKGGSAGSSGGSGGSAGGSGGSAGSSGGAGGAGGSSGTGGSNGGSGGSSGSAGTGGSAGSAGSAGGPPSSVATLWNDPDIGCVNCHGDNGEGIANRGPEMHHPNRPIFDYITRTGEDMQLNVYRDPMDPVDMTMAPDSVLDDIFTWQSSFPKPTTGAELFADYCSYCHGPDGKGGAAGVAYATAYHSWPQSFQRGVTGQMFIDHVRNGHVKDDMGNTLTAADRHEYMPPMNSSFITDAEIKLIENWLPKN